MTGVAEFREKIAVYGEGDREGILRAAAWAGEDPLRLDCAAVLADLRLDAAALVAALLREVPVPPGETVEGRFGEEAARLGEGLGRVAAVSAKSKTQQEAKNVRRMLLALTEDIRVLFIKLADRLCRMRNIAAGGEDPKAAAQECLDIYAPLADRLGISWIKDELEDLALKELNREAYTQIKEIVAEKRADREGFLRAVQEDLRRETALAGVQAEVESRAKHFYSIYQKMRKRNKAAGDLYDLLGIRIICGGVESCYTLLGLVHRLWKPVEGRFKDYIAMPKANGYQSLHTTVISGGRLLEIQIRSGEMHRIAEYGAASHWLYKQDVGRSSRQDVHQDAPAAAGTGGAGSEDLLEAVKREMLRDTIYVFTPQGKVLELPAGATAIDFAYSVHSAVGDHCAGARADGAIIPLSAPLSSTQVVEILTSAAARPHHNWLEIVKTPKARNKIRAWFQRSGETAPGEKLPAAKKKPPLPEGGGDRFPPTKSRGKEGPEKEAPPTRLADGEMRDILRVRVESDGGPLGERLMVRFARCCRPLTGDPITGYVSRGRGIIIHRKDCASLARIPDFEERRIEIAWEASAALIKRFRVEARARGDLFSEIDGAVRKNQGRLIEGRLHETGPDRLRGFFTMHLEQEEDLKKILKNLRAVPGILSVSL